MMGGMKLPKADSQLVQIVDASLRDAAQRAGDWLVCRPGCTQCCYGAFAINRLDVLRLQAGMNALRDADPSKAEGIDLRARAWLDAFGMDFPGDRNNGVLGRSEEERQQFEEFANDAPCPALDPATGLCDVYEWRPMTCRVFGPPIRMAAGEGSAPAEGLGHCELCFTGATEAEVAACEMPLPIELEEKILALIADKSETVVAFALMDQTPLSDQAD
jgi:Fe-S-cluster containining protein